MGFCNDTTTLLPRAFCVSLLTGYNERFLAT